MLLIFLVCCNFWLASMLNNCVFRGMFYLIVNLLFYFVYCFGSCCLAAVSNSRRQTIGTIVPINLYNMILIPLSMGVTFVTVKVTGSWPCVLYMWQSFLSIQTCFMYDKMDQWLEQLLVHILFTTILCVTYLRVYSMFTNVYSNFVSIFNYSISINNEYTYLT